VAELVVTIFSLVNESVFSNL